MEYPDDTYDDEDDLDDEEEDSLFFGVPWEELFGLSTEEVIRVNDNRSENGDAVRNRLQQAVEHRTPPPTLLVPGEDSPLLELLATQTRERASMTTALEQVADVVSVIHDKATLAWRFEELHRMGFSTEDALTLADTRGDLHEIWHGLRDGCPHATAVRIWS